MNDLISRKAAIEAIKEDKIDLTNPNIVAVFKATGDFEKVQTQIMTCDRHIKILKDLPSARPERTCVNCGRTVNNGGWYADGRTRCPIEEHYALPKDGFCHLWEKRNVTDDDYPERRTDGEIIPE